MHAEAKMNEAKTVLALLSWLGRRSKVKVRSSVVCLGERLCPTAVSTHVGQTGRVWWLDLYLGLSWQQPFDPLKQLQTLIFHPRLRVLHAAAVASLDSLSRTVGLAGGIRCSLNRTSAFIVRLMHKRDRALVFNGPLVSVAATLFCSQLNCKYSQIFQMVIKAAEAAVVLFLNF